MVIEAYLNNDDVIPARASPPRARVLLREVHTVTDHGVSRRSLFRAAGVGAAVAGGGRLVEACSSGIQGASTSTSRTGGSTPGATSGKEIPIGWIHPLTGSLAGF